MGWEKFEEVERMRDLERKRNEFLFKLRYLRPDAAEPEESFFNGSQGTRDGVPEREDVGPLEKEPKVEKSQAESTSQRKQEDFEEKMRKEKEKMQREEKMKTQFFEEQMQGGRTWESESNQNPS